MMPQLGIAVATTLGGWLNAGLLWSTLAKRERFHRRCAAPAQRCRCIVRREPRDGRRPSGSRAIALAPYLAAGSGFVGTTSALGVEIVVGFAVFGCGHHGIGRHVDPAAARRLMRHAAGPAV